MLLAPALSVSRGARGPGTGGGGWRRPRPWNGPGPAGLRGAQPPGRLGGRDKPPGLRLGRAGCSLRFELPSLLANSAAATSCQHVVPPTECLPPGCPTHPTQRPPAQRARRCKDLPGQGSHSPSPIVVADALGSWPAPHTTPPPPRSPRPPASNSCCPALGHTPPGDAAHALLAQNPQQLPPPRGAGPPLRARSAHTDGSTARGGGGCPGPRAPRTPARGDPGGLSGRPKSSTSPASFTGWTVTSCGPSVPRPRPSDGQGATREIRASRPCARNPAETENGGSLGRRERSGPTVAGDSVTGRPPRLPGNTTGQHPHCCRLRGAPRPQPPSPAELPAPKPGCGFREAPSTPDGPAVPSPGAGRWSPSSTHWGPAPPGQGSVCPKPPVPSP